MKSVDPTVSTAIRTAYEVNAVPRLTAEWNWNRYASVVQVDNDPSDDLQGYDIEMFPVSALVQPNRPTAGICKAMVGQALVADPYSPYDGKTRQARYYVADTSDVYKYWISPYQTDSSGNFPTDSKGSLVRPYVLYPNNVTTNKIVIKFEDTWAQPKSFTVQVKAANGNTWVVASSAPSIDSTGTATLYYNGTGWSKTKPTDQTPTTSISGIQVFINSLQAGVGGSNNGANSYASVIEISARLEQDLSNRLISVTDTFDMAEKSNVYPIGTITANTAQISLFNGDGLFNDSNTSSMYYGLTEPNVKFTLEYLYTVGTVTSSVQQFKMYSGPWNGRKADTVNINLTDFSQFLQQTKPNPTMYQNLSVAEIVWRICDSIGFVNYQIQSDDVTTQHKLDIWWTDGTKTAWQIFDELAQATQTAIYFDGFGNLQVQTRTNAFKTAAAPVWTLRGDDSGSELTDIVSLQQTDDLSSNKITVTYQPITIDPVINGLPKNQILWQPGGIEALRACPLVRDLSSTDTTVYISPNDALIWPFSGMMNIEGELIEYNGKQFNYWQNNQYHTVTVKSEAEHQKYNNLTPFFNQYKNYFTGGLMVTTRGLWNSDPKAHTINASGYTVHNYVSGVNHVGVGGFSQVKSESRALLESNYSHSTDYLLATRGQAADSGFYYYGAKFRFEKGPTWQQAGLVIHNNGTTEDGYYFELQPSNRIPAQNRGFRNEFLLFSRVNGVRIKIGTASLDIQEGVDYEMDITYTTYNGSQVLSAWVNGKKCGSWAVPSNLVNAWGGKFGMYTRGRTRASFEYLYAISREDNQPEDDYSFLDKVYGGYTGGQWDREWVFRSRTQWRRIKKHWTKETSRWNQQFYDEFGPIVHEVRQYNVKFTIVPALTSSLYLSNDYSIVCPEYRSDSFGATFYLSNTSRNTAIANGDDNLLYAGSGTAVKTIMAIIGRSVTTANANTVVVEDDDQIRARGPVETGISSQWIQSEEMATEIGNWIKSHWSKGADEQQVVIFGNPLLEIGDVVTINYPLMNMDSAHYSYFVVGSSTTFDTGMETTLTLRRVVV